MIAGEQEKYSIGSSNSDEYEEETHGTERVAIHVSIHTPSRPSTLRSFSSRQQTQMRAQHWAGWVGRQGSTPRSHYYIHRRSIRDLTTRTRLLQPTTRPGRLPLAGESWVADSLRSGSDCGCAVRKPRSGTCGTPWTSIIGDGPAVHLVSARRSRRLRLPASKGLGERYCTLAHSDAAWLIFVD